MLCIPSPVRSLLAQFESCFTAPGFRHFRRLLAGWILLRGCHTISRVFQASCALTSTRHHSSFYRFLSEGRWSLDAVGRVVFRLLHPWLPARLLVLIDDTLCARVGPQIFGAGVHLDATQSSYTGPGRRFDTFRFGHNWVVLAIWIPCPWKRETGWAIPLLFRLFRPKKSTAASAYRKRSELAAEMIACVATWRAPAQTLYVAGDGAYCCKTVLQALPKDVFFVGPVRLDAALYELPREPSRRGRPRLKGYRIASPRQRLANKEIWRAVEVRLYASAVALEVWTEVCLWYPSAGTHAVRVVGTRDPRGRLEPRAFVCTDPTLDVDDVMTLYGCRWQIEVTFRDIKQELGFGDARNGWWRRPQGQRADTRRNRRGPPRKRGARAAQRTAPLAAIAYAIVVVWYLEHGNPQQDVADVRRRAPWYTAKKHPSFADMLAALRRRIWLRQFRRMRLSEPIRQKLTNLLDYAGIAA